MIAAIGNRIGIQMQGKQKKNTHIRANANKNISRRAKTLKRNDLKSEKERIYREKHM